MNPPPNGFAFERVDLSDTRAAEAVVERVAEAGGGLRGVVTAAGTDACGRPDDVPPETWERVRAVEPPRPAAGGPAPPPPPPPGRAGGGPPPPPAPREGGGRPRRAAAPRARRRARRHRRLDARAEGGQRCDRVLRLEVRRRRVHARARGRDRGAGRRDAAHPRRHADRVLRRADRAVQAAARREARAARRDRRRCGVRAEPAARGGAARARDGRPDGAVLAVTPRLVVLRALGLGDFLTAVPALRALQAAFPDHRRLRRAPTWLEPLAALLGGAVSEIVDVEGRAAVPAALPPVAHGADVAVNLHGRGPQSTELLRATLPGRLVAFGLPGGPAWRAEEHEVARWCR